MKIASKHILYLLHIYQRIALALLHISLSKVPVAGKINAPKIPFEMSIPQQHAFYVHYIKNIDSSQKILSTLSLLYYILGNIRDNNIY